MGANYFGHFLLTGLLLDIITKTHNSRIVSLASLAHRSGRISFEDMHWENTEYHKMRSYGQSKLACLMFSDELQRRLDAAGKTNTISVAAHPGMSPTELFRDFPKLLFGLMKITIMPFISQVPNIGALPTLMAALDPSVIGGQYFGPQGYRKLRGKPGVSTRNRYSKDLAIAKKLFDVSEELTGEKYQFS